MNNLNDNYYPGGYAQGGDYRRASNIYTQNERYESNQHPPHDGGNLEQYHFEYVPDDEHLPSIHEYVPGDDNLPNIHEYVPSDEHLPNIHEYVPHSVGGDNIQNSYPPNYAPPLPPPPAPPYSAGYTHKPNAGNGDAFHHKHNVEAEPPDLSRYAFYPDPLDVSIHNSKPIDPAVSHQRKKQLMSISSEYENLVRDHKNSRLKVNPVLLSSDVHEQVVYASSNAHRPYFMFFVILVQTVLLVYSYYLNYEFNGYFAQKDFPYSQDQPTLVAMGARYFPCMRPNSDVNVKDEVFPCSLGGIQYNCNLGEFCSLIPELVPHQIYRLFTAIFLHVGILHYLFNVVIFQIFTGIPIERDIGSIRVAFIYILSGIGGFLFIPAEVGDELSSTTVGASGAIYGLISCILIDLIFSWKLLRKPVWELFIIIVKIALSLSFGYIIPGVDNFAHFGGLIVGILSSALVLPSVYFGSWDKTGKFIIKFASFPLLILFFVFNYYAFINRYYFCPACAFLQLITSSCRLLLSL